jgi:hypothetical protein
VPGRCPESLGSGHEILGSDRIHDGRPD